MWLGNENHEETRTNLVTLIFLLSRVTIFVTLMTESYPAGYKRIINTRWSYDAPEFSTAVWI